MGFGAPFAEVLLGSRETRAVKERKGIKRFPGGIICAKGGAVRCSFPVPLSKALFLAVLAHWFQFFFQVWEHENAEIGVDEHFEMFASFPSSSGFFRVHVGKKAVQYGVQSAERLKRDKGDVGITFLQDKIDEKIRRYITPG